MVGRKEGAPQMNACEDLLQEMQQPNQLLLQCIGRSKDLQMDLFYDLWIIFFKIQFDSLLGKESSFKVIQNII